MLPLTKAPVLRLLSIALAILVGVATPTRAKEGLSGLNDIERQVQQSHPGVRSLIAEDFEQRLARGEEVLVLDVREKEEFAVSRLRGAERVEPDITSDQFLARYGDRLAGKTVLLYCSVGVRSSRLAERIDTAVRQAGSRGAFNLRGGVFAWHNTGRQLENASGATEAVHGYSASWARLVEFGNLVTVRWRSLWR
jgi:rhodanese-related sulfurtransferase